MRGSLAKSVSLGTIFLYSGPFFREGGLRPSETDLNTLEVAGVCRNSGIMKATAELLSFGRSSKNAAFLGHLGSPRWISPVWGYLQNFPMYQLGVESCHRHPWCQGSAGRAGPPELWQLGTRSAPERLPCATFVHGNLGVSSLFWCGLDGGLPPDLTCSSGAPRAGCFLCGPQ